MISQRHGVTAQPVSIRSNRRGNPPINIRPPPKKKNQRRDIFGLSSPIFMDGTFCWLRGTVMAAPDRKWRSKCCLSISLFRTSRSVDTKRKLTTRTSFERECNYSNCVHLEGTRLCLESAGMEPDCVTTPFLQRHTYTLWHVFLVTSTLWFERTFNLSDFNPDLLVIFFFYQLVLADFLNILWFL